ncbi:MAG TPA: DUF2332 domain-containing protein [Pseudonocardiaceae bacterium]|jgi:hypothetical protein|nr:DUF2332 domain-containing protein [Pseudonocardiaceae bacterium]
MTGVDLARERLLTFAKQEAAGESPLYEHLAQAAGADDEVAALLTAAAPEQARATLFFAATHRLVIAEPTSELAYYYPSVGGDRGVDDGTWPTFRAFVLDRAERLRELIATRATQTNEVRRAALLYPALVAIGKQAGGPLGLLEVGTSAGLLLGVDRYGYRYQLAGGEQVSTGPAKAALVLTSQLGIAEGAKKPALPRKLAIGAKLGLDPRPVDLGDEEQLAWLEACIWADQVDRIRLLNTAARVQAADPPELITGDAVEDLAAAAARIPTELPLVVLTSHALPYLDAGRRGAFIAALAELAASRPLWWLSQEVYETCLHALLPGRTDLALAEAGTATLGLVRWTDGKPQARALARTGMHGQSLEWLAR